jgi:hypothetical protein
MAETDPAIADDRILSTIEKAYSEEALASRQCMDLLLDHILTYLPLHYLVQCQVLFCCGSERCMQLSKALLSFD